MARALRTRLVGDRPRDWQVYHQLVAENLRRGMTVLDIGCGKGNIAPFPWRDYPDVTRLGLDQNPAARHNPYLDEFFLVQDGEPWPLDDSIVDLAVSRYVLEHVVAPRAFLRSVQRVLKPGGTFIFLTPNLWHPAMMLSRLLPLSWKQSILGLAKDVAPEDVYRTYYRMNSPWRVRELGERVGFSVECAAAREFVPCDYLDFFLPGFLAFYTYFLVVSSTGLDRSLGAQIIGLFRKT